MLEIITKSICCILYAVIDFYVMKKLLLSDEKINTLKNIFLLALIALSYIILYSNEFNIYLVIQKTLLGVIINCIIFNEPLYKTVIAYVIYMLINLFADLLNTFIYTPFISVKTIRSNYIFIILTNCTVSITLFLLLKIKFILEKLQQLIALLKNKSNTQTLIFYALIYGFLINIAYKITSNEYFNYYNLLNYLNLFIVMILLLIYTMTKLNYFNLIQEYDVIHNFLQEYEENNFYKDFSIHEYNNQLAILKNYILEELYDHALNFIDDMSKENYQENHKILLDLKNIPKGGIKGIICYKVLIAEKNKLSINIDISNNVYNIISRINQKKVDIISRLVGIYIDNAIDSAKDTQRKLLSIEIYLLDEELHFVISNSFNMNEINIDKIGKKGYTTKGKGHGKGLYLSKRILSRNNWLGAENRIINKIYVQKLIIKKLKYAYIECKDNNN